MGRQPKSISLFRKHNSHWLRLSERGFRHLRLLYGSRVEDGVIPVSTSRIRCPNTHPIEAELSSSNRRFTHMIFTITAMWRKLGVTVLAVLSVCLLSQPLTAEEEDLLKPLLLIAFEQDSPDVGWYVQNDNVMGGQSVGGFSVRASELIFSGNTNTNGGGFSSIRSQPLELDLADYDGIRLTVKADGRRYTWSLQTDARWRGRKINYWADFETVPGEVYVVDVPFERFMPQFRGFKLDGPTLDRSQIREFALYQYDKTDGPFELRLIKAEAYTDGH